MKSLKDFKCGLIFLNVVNVGPKFPIFGEITIKATLPIKCRV